MKRITAIFLSAVLCFFLISPCASAKSSMRDTSLEQSLASDLKALSLFKGVSDADFALSNAPTRVEAVVMLIRMLGKENEALSGEWEQPFGDVAPWADKYIGYAYYEGLTQGVSNTQFGIGNASSATFLTLVLRALGYSDANGDFSFSDPYSLAKSIGILPSEVDTTNFLRADAVLVSYSAISANIKGTNKALAEKLISDGVFTKAQYENYYDSSAISKAEAGLELSAEQVFIKCSPAVFYIAVYDKSGNVSASGSGFFIDSAGTAVTNYHVIKGAASAKITVSGTNKVFDVAGIYDYSEDNDWAILKISGSGFSYLDIGDSDSVIGGATVYAIGSPLGLQNTITSGIVSNASRVEDGISYIQISAAISHGSSGGALINKFGKVIGITSASYTDGQNLNLALPVTYISGYRTSTYEVFADFVSETAITLYSSVSNVENQVGSSSTVYLKYTGDDASLILPISSDLKVAAVSSLDITTAVTTYSFTISGLKPGAATISMSDGKRHSVKIAVTVSNNAPDDVLKKYLE